MIPYYNTDKLYLLEIMVSRLRIDYDKLGLDSDCLDSLKQIIVLCKFQELPAIQIREEEFCPDRAEQYSKVSEVVLQTGKSCLFSARSLSEDLDFFTIKVKVAREKVSGGCMELGSTCVKLDSQFVEVLKYNGSQNSRTIDETYPLYCANYNCIGNITLSVRLSSLGKTILTSVQGGVQGSDAYVVKGEGMIDPGFIPQTTYAGDWYQDRTDYNTYGRLLGGMEQAYPQYRPQTPLQPLDNSPMVVGGQYTLPTYGNQPTPMVGQQQPQAGKRSSPFCGHVNIRSSSSSDEERPPQPPSFPPEMFCNCEYPLPPGFDQPYPPPPPKKKRKPKVPCPLELKGNYCIRPNCPMGFPQMPRFPQNKKDKEICTMVPMDPAIGLGANNTMFQYPQLQQQYIYGAPQQHMYNTQQQLTRPGPNTFTLEDDKNDIYILKIGSKHDANKPKFVLELKTPKLKMVDIKTQEMDSQYRVEDFTPPVPAKDTKKKGKKGKKGKGKQKGKKGKGKKKGKK